LNEKNETYILKGCYFYIKNFLRKNRKKKIISLEEILENGQNIKNLEFMDEYNLNNYEENFETLNEREKTILNLFINGYTTREIGRKLGISHVMVIKIKKRIKEKLSEIRNL